MKTISIFEKLFSNFSDTIHIDFWLKVKFKQNLELQNLILQKLKTNQIFLNTSSILLSTTSLILLSTTSNFKFFELKDTRNKNYTISEFWSKMIPKNLVPLFQELLDYLDTCLSKNNEMMKFVKLIEDARQHMGTWTNKQH